MFFLSFNVNTQSLVSTEWSSINNRLQIFPSAATLLVQKFLIKYSATVAIVDSDRIFTTEYLSKRCK